MLNLNSKNPVNCPIVRCLNLIRGKWKAPILHMLSERPLHNGEILRKLPGVSQKVITQQLRQLEQNKLVNKRPYGTKVKRVEYSLSPLGVDFLEVLEAMHNWSANNL